MSRYLDDADRRVMGTLEFPPCPVCNRRMVEANLGTEDRKNGIFVCCDPRCIGRKQHYSVPCPDCGTMLSSFDLTFGCSNCDQMYYIPTAFGHKPNLSKIRRVGK